MEKKLKRTMIVDGYNIIRSSLKYKPLIDEGPNITDVYVRAREALIADVAAAAHNSYTAVIVFDGKNNPNSEGVPTKVAGVTIQFSPYKKEADELIEQLATKAREAGQEVFVVTSDQATQWTVFGDGVTRISARMFEQEIDLMNNSIDEMTQVYTKQTIQDRIDPKVVEKLKRMIRGEK